jgi:hypothetical protein
LRRRWFVCDWHRFGRGRSGNHRRTGSEPLRKRRQPWEELADDREPARRRQHVDYPRSLRRRERIHALAEPLDDGGIRFVQDVHHHRPAGSQFLGVVRAHATTQRDAFEEAVTVVEAGHR